MVIVGPDGSGKTTVARRLLERHDGRYFHFRPPFRSTSMPPLPPTQEAAPTKEPPPSATPVGWLRIARNFLSSWIGYLTAVRPSLRRGDLVIGDRWMYGYLVQPRPLRFNGPHWLARKLISALPEPDLVVNLTAPVSTIHERKQELNSDQIQEELRGWSGLPVGKLVTVENSESPEITVDEIEAHLAAG